MIFNEVKKRVARNVRRIRLEAGLDYPQFAKQCGLVKNNVYKYESGEMNVTLKTMHRICEATQRKFSDLFRGLD